MLGLFHIRRIKLISCLRLLLIATLMISGCAEPKTPPPPLTQVQEDLAVQSITDDLNVIEAANSQREKDLSLAIVVRFGT